MGTKHDLKTHKQSHKMALMQHIMDRELRVFRRQELQAILPADLAITYNGLSKLLGELVNTGWLRQIKKGLYAQEYTATPIHEYEIGSKLVEPAMISYRSAYSYHGLTDQILHGFYITTTSNHFVPSQKDARNRSTSLTLQGVTYEFVRIEQKKYFGGETAWVGDGRFLITDFERTLIDGLARPEYCGGFQEVIYAYTEYFAKAKLKKLIDYGMRFETSVSRRLGWVLDNILNIETEDIACLRKQTESGYRLLDPNRPSKGPYDRKWGLRLNHHY